MTAPEEGAAVEVTFTARYLKSMHDKVLLVTLPGDDGVDPGIIMVPLNANFRVLDE